MGNKKGDRRERELLKELDKQGFASMRAPASGSGGKRADGSERELPDIICGNGLKTYAIESKSVGGDYVYIDGGEIQKLTSFAEEFGAIAIIGVRFDYKPWVFYTPEELYRTDAGNYRIKRDEVEEGTEIENL